MDVGGGADGVAMNGAKRKLDEDDEDGGDVAMEEEAMEEEERRQAKALSWTWRCARAATFTDGPMRSRRRAASTSASAPLEASWRQP